MSHTHFNLESRVLLAQLLNQDYDYNEIASILDKHVSSIYREIDKNSKKDGTYIVGYAQRKANVRRAAGKATTHKLLKNAKLASYVESKLKKSWSPEQICGRLKVELGNKALSTRTIYHYIYKHKPQLSWCLRYKRDGYRRRYGTRIEEKRREEAKIRRIDTRPEIVEQRVRLGDWEADTVVGTDRKQAIVTLVDRTSGYLIAKKITRGTADMVKDTIVKSFKSLPLSKRHTITFDNGKEFNHYQAIEKETKATTYFAYPYRSWERAINEYTNGLLREFVPKKTPLTIYTDQDIKKAVTKINHRPKKRLGYLTPHEVFNSFCISN